MKVTHTVFTMFGSEGKKILWDCGIEDAVKELRKDCDTVILYDAVEYEVEIKDMKKFKVSERFDITPKHERNKKKE